MTPEEKTIQRMRRSIPRNRTTVFVIVFGMCVILASFVSIVIWEAQLDDIHDKMREHTNHSVLSYLLAEQSRLETAISVQLPTLLIFAVLYGFIVGNLTFGKKLNRLTLAMWDKIQRLENETHQSDRKTSHESSDNPDV